MLGRELPSPSRNLGNQPLRDARPSAKHTQTASRSSLLCPYARMETPEGKGKPPNPPRWATRSQTGRIPYSRDSPQLLAASRSPSPVAHSSTWFSLFPFSPRASRRPTQGTQVPCRMAAALDPGRAESRGCYRGEGSAGLNPGPCSACQRLKRTCAQD